MHMRKLVFLVLLIIGYALPLCESVPAQTKSPKTPQQKLATAETSAAQKYFTDV